MVDAQWPKVTFALFAYNQEKYIREAVEGALAQDCPPIEIILSDDCSSDLTYDFMVESATKKKVLSHNVILNKNSINLGLSAHVNKIFGMASGDIILVAAGDDISFSSRARATVKAFMHHPKAYSVSFGHVVISGTGERRTKRWSRFLRARRTTLTFDGLVTSKRHMSGASRGIRREVYDFFGDLSEDCPTEDTPYLLRAALLGEIMSFRSPQIYYRSHEGNLSSPSSLRRMDPSKISSQYLMDFEVAVRARKVTPDKRADLERWISHWNQKRSATRPSL